MNYINPYDFMKELSKHVDDNAIIVTDSGATLAWTCQGFNPKPGNRLFSAMNHSPMGYALPASIGAYYACPDRQIICICGDGAMSMNIQELETIAYNKLPIKIFIMNNNEYGIINQTFRTWLDSTAASDPGNGLGFCNFASIGEAYNILSCKLESIASIKSLLKQSQLLCVVPIKPGSDIIPKLKYGKRLEEI